MSNDLPLRRSAALLSVSLMALALLFPLSVHAGSYLGPVYSGGTYYGKGTDGTTTGVKTWPDKPLTATVKGTSYTGWGGYGIDLHRHGTSAN